MINMCQQRAVVFLKYSKHIKNKRKRNMFGLMLEQNDTCLMEPSVRQILVTAQMGMSIGEERAIAQPA